jgi:hypothetical protein
LVVTPDFPPAFGGIQRMMFRLAEHFERVETRVIALGRADANGFDKTHGLDVVRRDRPPQRRRVPGGHSVPAERRPQRAHQRQPGSHGDQAPA